MNQQMNQPGKNPDQRLGQSGEVRQESRRREIGESCGQLLLPLEAVTQPADSDVQIGRAASAFSDSGDRRLTGIEREGVSHSACNFVVTQTVTYRNLIKNLFSGVHAPNYTRMDSFTQCANGRLFDNFDPRLNTEGMKKTPAQLIADALDFAMQTAHNGKRMSQAELSRQSGVPQPTISRTLSGETIPELATLAPLIHVLGKGNVDLAPSIEALLPRQDAGELSDEEVDLVTAYRRLNETQKTMVMMAAKSGANRNALEESMAKPAEMKSSRRKAK